MPEEGKTLLEQGVGLQATLLLLTPTSLVLSVVTASGLVLPAVVEQRSDLHGVDEALGHLVGCPKHLRRFIIAKRLVEDEKPVSPGVNEVQMWLTLGKGASTRVKTNNRATLLVETDSAHSTEEI